MQAFTCDYRQQAQTGLTAASWPIATPIATHVRYRTGAALTSGPNDQTRAFPAANPTDRRL
jgi:hypothetical protein